MNYFVYRVISITSCKSHNLNNYIPLLDDLIDNSNFSLPTYCAPDVVFWLTEDGIENPDSECLILNIDCEMGQIVFEWDGGEYIGFYNSWGPINEYLRVYNISSIS